MPCPAAKNLLIDHDRSWLIDSLSKGLLIADNMVVGLIHDLSIKKYLF